MQRLNYYLHNMTGLYFLLTTMHSTQQGTKLADYVVMAIAIWSALSLTSVIIIDFFITVSYSHVAVRPPWPQTVGTKLKVDFSERFDPSNYKIGLEKIFHQCPFF